jgi:hypothetical protein
MMTTTATLELSSIKLTLAMMKLQTQIATIEVCHGGNDDDADDDDDDDVDYHKTTMTLVLMLPRGQLLANSLGCTLPAPLVARGEARLRMLVR